MSRGERHPLVEAVDIVAAHGFRFAGRLLDRFMPPRRVLELKPVELEKSAAVVPTPKLGPAERAPWVHLAASCWSTTFRIAIEALNRKDGGHAQDVETAAGGTAPAA